MKLFVMVFILMYAIDIFISTAEAIAIYAWTRTASMHAGLVYIPLICSRLNTPNWRQESRSHQSHSRKIYNRNLV